MTTAHTHEARALKALAENRDQQATVHALLAIADAINDASRARDGAFL